MITHELDSILSKVYAPHIFITLPNILGCLYITIIILTMSI